MKSEKIIIASDLGGSATLVWGDIVGAIVTLGCGLQESKLIPIPKEVLDSLYVPLSYPDIAHLAI